MPRDRMLSDAAAPRHRTHRPSPVQPPSRQDPGWSSTAALPSALEGREDLRLVPQLRRIVVRWERHSKMYLAFLHVACLMITLRHL